MRHKGLPPHPYGHKHGFPHQSVPGCDRLCWTCRKVRCICFPFTTPLPGWVQDDAFGTGSDIVFHLFHKKAAGQHNLLLPTQSYQMQMRAERITRIPAILSPGPAFYRYSRFGTISAPLSFSYRVFFPLQATSPTNALRWRLIVE